MDTSNSTSRQYFSFVQCDLCQREHEKIRNSLNTCFDWLCHGVSIAVSVSLYLSNGVDPLISACAGGVTRHVLKDSEVVLRQEIETYLRERRCNHRDHAREEQESSRSDLDWVSDRHRFQQGFSRAIAHSE